LTPSEEDAREQGSLIFEAEIAVAGGLAAEVANLALDPDLAEGGLDEGANRAGELGDGPDMDLGLGLARRGGLGEEVEFHRCNFLTAD
jgi:hypothetical protein